MRGANVGSRASASASASSSRAPGRQGKRDERGGKELHKEQEEEEEKKSSAHIGSCDLLLASIRIHVLAQYGYMMYVLYLNESPLLCSASQRTSLRGTHGVPVGV